MIDTVCPELEHCRDRRTLDAEHRGAVMEKLNAINSNITALQDEMKVNRNDIKNLYFRIGLISGGTSLIVSLVVSLLAK